MSEQTAGTDGFPCPKCGASRMAVSYRRHCSRRDCDHKFCGDRLDLECAICRYSTTRRPLDAVSNPPGATP